MTSFRVVLAGIPRELASYGLERTEELIREFRLMADSGAERGDLPRRITTHLAALRDAGDGRAALVSAGVEEQPPGDAPTLAVEMELPVGAERDALTLAMLLDESDDYCRRGAVLTLPRTELLVRLRWWQATEVVRQRHGLPATAFSA